MSYRYMPMMFDMRGRSILIVGGGAIAHEKLTRLCDLEATIKVVALAYSEAMKELCEAYHCHYETRPFCIEDLDGTDIVIVAVDDMNLQQSIYDLATQKKILCNAVDLSEACHFIFPSIIRQDDLIVAVSTSGASPAFAKHLKRFLQALIPSDVGAFLQMMRQKRDQLPKGKERMKMLDALACEYIKRWGQKNP